MLAFFLFYAIIEKEKIIVKGENFMQKMLVLLTVLVIAFGCLWAYKLNTAEIEAAATLTTSETKEMWWLQDTEYSIEDVDEEWLLDATIPSNYVPVPDGDELYMVIDNDGNVVEYRHRYKLEGDDNTWYWETVEQEEDYIPVEDVENLYTVTGENGETEYYKYIRNEDGTYAYVQSDEDGNNLELQEQAKTAQSNPEQIPDNFIKIDDDIYAVTNDYGVIIGYVQKKENTDGTIEWVEISQSSVENLVKEDAAQNQNETSTKGNNLIVTSPVVTTSKQNTVTKAPSSTVSSNSNSSTTGSTTGKQNENIDVTEKTYTKEVSETSTKIVGDYKITYETVYVYTYDSEGNLISTTQNPAKEISRVKVDEGTIGLPERKDTLDDEVERAMQGMTIDETMAQTILNKLNAERAAENKSALSMTVNSDIYKAAVLYACDMATYNHSDVTTMNYGKLTDLFKLYNITVNSSVGQHLWRCLTTNTASDIHSRFQSLETCRNERMSSSFTNIAIVVINKNGYYYVCELLY